MIRCLLSLIVSFLSVANVHAFVASEQYSEIEYKDLSTNPQGYLTNTTGDGFLVLNNIELNRAQMCGLMLTLEFQQAPERASIFDVYWRTAKTGFSESQKGFFVINQTDAATKNSYLVPLCKLFNFSGNLNQPQQQANITGFRFDYPANKTLALRIESIKFLSSEAMAKLEESGTDAIVVEPYERISARSFTSLDVIIPKLIFAFEEGLKRFTKDGPFLVFWLVLILILKLLILRSFMREFKTDDDSDN